MSYNIFMSYKEKVISYLKCIDGILGYGDIVNNSIAVYVKDENTKDKIPTSCHGILLETIIL
jgi:hypothetical protein